MAVRVRTLIGVVVDKAVVVVIVGMGMVARKVPKDLDGDRFVGHVANADTLRQIVLIGNGMMTGHGLGEPVLLSTSPHLWR
jgi:hypothetical protein